MIELRTAKIGQRKGQKRIVRKFVNGTFASKTLPAKCSLSELVQRTNALLVMPERYAVPSHKRGCDSLPDWLL